MFGKKKFRLDYMGSKSFYINARDEYKAGEPVVLSFPFIATDTKYSFFIDGKEINYSYNDKHCIELRFIMPDHDAVLECVHKNIMLCDNS